MHCDAQCDAQDRHCHDGGSNEESEIAGLHARNLDATLNPGHCRFTSTVWSVICEFNCLNCHQPATVDMLQLSAAAAEKSNQKKKARNKNDLTASQNDPDCAAAGFWAPFGRRRRRHPAVSLLLAAAASAASALRAPRLPQRPPEQTPRYSRRGRASAALRVRARQHRFTAQLAVCCNENREAGGGSSSSRPTIQFSVLRFSLVAHADEKKIRVKFKLAHHAPVHFRFLRLAACRRVPLAALLGRLLGRSWCCALRCLLLSLLHLPSCIPEQKM